MKIGQKRSIPEYIKRKMPGGIERFNTISCRYYGIIGLSRKVKGWYMGMFMEWIFDWYEADYILDLEEGVWWSTGRNDLRAIERLEAEYRKRRAV
jgi:hypothetical protein